MVLEKLAIFTFTKGRKLLTLKLSFDDCWSPIFSNTEGIHIKITAL